MRTQNKQIHARLSEPIRRAVEIAVSKRRSNPATTRSGTIAAVLEEALLMHPEVLAHIQMEQEAA